MLALSLWQDCSLYVLRGGSALACTSRLCTARSMRIVDPLPCVCSRDGDGRRSSRWRLFFRFGCCLWHVSGEDLCGVALVILQAKSAGAIFGSPQKFIPGDMLNCADEGQFENLSQPACLSAACQCRWAHNLKPSALRCPNDCPLSVSCAPVRAGRGCRCCCQRRRRRRRWPLISPITRSHYHQNNWHYRHYRSHRRGRRRRWRWHRRNRRHRWVKEWRGPSPGCVCR